MLYKESITIPWHRYPDEAPEHGRPVFFKNPAEPTLTEINTVGYEHDLSKGSLWVYPNEISTYVLPADKPLTKIDYSKMKLVPVCRMALIASRTVALHLEHNREYLLNHFGETEFEQGIAFLKKIEAIC